MLGVANFSEARTERNKVSAVFPTELRVLVVHSRWTGQNMDMDMERSGNILNGGEAITIR